MGVGMDAQVAFGFHNFRNHMPWLARGRIANQAKLRSFSGACLLGFSLLAKKKAFFFFFLQ